MADQPTGPAPTDRRTVLRATALGVAVAGVGVTAAACSSSNSLPQSSNAQTGAAAPAATGPVTVTTTSKVPVDGGFIDGELGVVVTQPDAGDYKAFSAICTHAQCTVASVSNNVIQCNCHGSQYSAKDGSVITGPATQALAPKNIKVTGENIVYEP